MSDSLSVAAVRLCIDANDVDRVSAFWASLQTRKNRLHLDVFVPDPDPWIQRCVDLGATLLGRSEDPDDWFQVIADPEGNELCICRSA